MEDLELELLIKVTKARLTARQAFMANMLGNVRQLLRDLPLDRPLIEHTDEEIIALVRRMFREGSAKRELALEPQHREAEAEAMTGEPKRRSEHECAPDPPGRGLRTAPELANGYEVRANAFINWSGSSLVISILPKVSKAVWRHLGVANRVLDVLVPEE